MSVLAEESPVAAVSVCWDEAMRADGTRWALLGVAALLLVACGGGSGGEPDL